MLDLLHSRSAGNHHRGATPIRLNTEFRADRPGLVAGFCVKLEWYLVSFEPSSATCVPSGLGCVRPLGLLSLLRGAVVSSAVG